MGAINDQFDAMELQWRRNRALAEFDIPALGILEAAGLADPRRINRGHGLVDLGLDQVLDLVRKLQPVRAEELDAIVIIRVMGRADDDPGLGPKSAGQIGNGGGRHRPGQQRIDTSRGETRLQRRFKHISGDAGVLADKHSGILPIPRKNPAGCPTQLQNEIGGDRISSHLATYAIGSEICTAHALSISPNQNLPSPGRITP